MTQLADPLPDIDPRTWQLAEVRGLNRRLELANRDLGRELHSARTRLGQLECQLAEARTRVDFRVRQLEQELRELRELPLRWRYRVVDGCLGVLKGIPLLGPLLRLARRLVGATLRR
jgi:hypothetical protein